MKVTYYSLKQTGRFNRLFLDYIEQCKNLSTFYSYLPIIDAFAYAINDILKVNINRKLLTEVIIEQYQKSNCPLPNGLELLLHENTFTVCTGHQLCLFTGPLYVIYKIITTINLAEALKNQYSDYNFIPIFWMLSEDHDFEEVNYVNVFGKKIEWKKKQGGAVGRYSTKGMDSVISELKNVLGDALNAQELIQLFTDAYVKHSNYASATRYLINKLFGRYGLLILDADDKRLKNEFHEVIYRDIFDNINYNAVSKTISDLKSYGYDAQVIPKEVNFFILSKNFRARIYKHQVEKEPEVWKKKLQIEIERFSPNVVTRSLYQQKILPNIAYVGGPAEIAYWLEYKKMFESNKVFFPVLIPRNFVHLNIGIHAENIFTDELQERYNNFSEYYIKYNMHFFEILKQNLNPFDFRFIILSEE
jgi:bacillithiol biosynthesis cysteine-adding enzyme BshC